MKEMTLNTSVQFCKGVGPARVTEFAKLGISTVRDLLTHYPRSYIFAVHRNISDLQDGEFSVVKGTVNLVGNDYSRGKVSVILADGTGSIECTWFNQPFMARAMKKYATVTLWGKVTTYKGVVQMVNSKYSFNAVGVPQGDGGGTPVYPATKKLTSNTIENIVKQALPCVDRSPFYAHDMRWRMGLHERGFIRRNEAIRYVHQPPSKHALKLARKRLVYEEFRTLAIRMRVKRMSQTNYDATVMSYGNVIHSRITAALGVELTQDQQGAIQDIVNDVCYGSGVPMYRLLQGDVGCGKTMVAVYAALLMAVNKRQTVIMCPTKILAQQHYDEIRELLEGSRFSACLLTNDTNCAPLPWHIKDGAIDIIIATTSVLSNKIGFKDLGLLIIDEEHRFGVKQKEKLVTKYKPHQLFMSATPIPKALTATAFGDLDVSVIKEMPVGRGNRETDVILPQHIEQMRDFIGRHIASGGQVYDVYPRIEGKGGLEEAYANSGMRDAVMMHGGQDNATNRTAIACFRNASAKILMCTSMIEVGVHVPNANIMVIHEAHMFGLSQLHQLRGRIGRSSKDSTCFLMCDTDNEDAIERLKFLESCDDGFEVAEQDLMIRGPGELLGTAQHGMPELKLADLITDYKLLMMAKGDI